MKKNKKVLEIFFSSYLLVRLISTYLAAFCGCLLLPSFQAGQGKEGKKQQQQRRKRKGEEQRKKKRNRIPLIYLV